jgi:hypothetical protein
MFESVQKRAAVIARSGLKVRRLVVSCRKLLSERGEAAGVSLATLTLDLYRSLDKKDQARFFATLLAEFSPDPAEPCWPRRRRTLRSRQPSTSRNSASPPSRRARNCCGG